MVTEVLLTVAAALVLTAAGAMLVIQWRLLSSLKAMSEDRERDRQVISNAMHAFAEAMCQQRIPGGTTHVPPTRRELQRAAAAAYIERVNRFEPAVRVKMPRED